ncbi:TerC family protein [Enterovirga sp. CN4-39]|uniref:TerC family protein n=1 Tax=Enterovirga sp. CN4-39 TaxID=3400910 RepID=UPI003BFD83E4
METLGPQLIKVLEIIWINIILSGDNAVVIALACRGLPPHQQRTGMVLGAGVAVVLRIVFTVLVATLLTTPFLKILGGLLLLWVAVKLLTGEEEAEAGIRESERLWHAVKTVAIADAVMSLDNVLAIAAVAKDSTVMLVLGLAISIPLIVAGASLIIKLLERMPLLVWAGAALLGWIAGEMLISDPALVSRLGEDLAHRLDLPAALIGAVFVVGLGFALTRRAAVSRA